MNVVSLLVSWRCGGYMFYKKGRGGGGIERGDAEEENDNDDDGDERQRIKKGRKS